MELIKALESTDKELSKRFSLVCALINYPTVFVEMQSFIQCLFKASIGGQYHKYGISCDVKNARLSKYLFSDEFCSYFKAKFYFNDFDILEDLNYLANKHKHDETIDYERDDVKIYFRLIYSIAKQYIEKTANLNVDSFTESLFKNLVEENDAERLTKNITIIKNELEEIKKSYQLLNTEELQIAKNRVFDLEKIVKLKEKECEKLRKQVEELSNQVDYSGKNMFAFKLDSTIKATELVELKRAGKFLESFKGYVGILESTNYAYDYNNFWGMFKVTMLLREFSLAKSLLFSIFHYEFNYFTKTMGKGGSLEQAQIMMQCRQFLQANRQFEQVFREGLESKKIPGIAIVSVYSINLMNAYYHLLIGLSYYNKQSDTFGPNTEEMLAYLEEVQTGRNSTIKGEYFSHDIYRQLTTTSLPLSLILIMFSDDEFSTDFDNLAVIDIYHIKEKTHDVLRRLIK